MSESDQMPDDRDKDVADEWETDQLVRLVGRHAEAALDPAEPALERAHEWASREARLAQGAQARQRTATEGAAFAQAILRRLEAARTDVTCVDMPAPTRPAPVVATLGRVRETVRGTGYAPHLDLAVAAGVGRELWDQACEEWVELPPGLPRGDYLSLTVAGDSMTPVLHPGDVMLVKLGGERDMLGELPREAMVVARRPEEGYVVKRLGRVTEREVELVSLNPAYPPIVLARGRDVIVGTVVLRWCAHGRRAS